MQDRVAISVAGVIEPALRAAEAGRSAARQTADLTAYDLYLRAHTMILSRKRQISEALGLLRQAIDRDPRYGPALAWAGICYFHLDMNGGKDDPEFDYRDGVDFAHRALEMAADDPDTLANAALALGYFGEDIDAMLAVADRALGLNPSFARGWHVSGLLRMWAGDVDRAIEYVQISLQLSPWVRAGLGTIRDGRSPFLRWPVRSSRGRIAISGSGRAKFRASVSLSSGVLRADGTTRRSEARSPIERRARWQPRAAQFPISRSQPPPAAPVGPAPSSR